MVIYGGDLLVVGPVFIAVRVAVVKRYTQHAKQLPHTYLYVASVHYVLIVFP